MGYLNLVGSFVYKEPLFRSKLDALAENDAQLKIDGWVQNTKTLFYQASAPAGWTQDVSQNDKAIRVVGSIGGAGSGGSKVLSSTISLAHTHTLATPSQGGHTHTYSDHTHPLGVPVTARVSDSVIADNAGYLYAFAESGGTTSISELKSSLATAGALILSTQADHNHGTPSTSLTDFVFAYCDVIIATKNAAVGTYTDLTTYWHTGDKIDFDPFTAYANNDAYNLGNLMPAGSLMIFAQPAAPIGWTKNISLNDRMLRIVSGAGGGSGGSALLSSGVTLAHSHNLTAVADHSHSYPGHTHHMTTGASITVAIPAAAGYGYIQDGIGGGGGLAFPDQVLGLSSSPVTVYKSQSSTFAGSNTSADAGHTHIMPAALADFTLAYVDVIKCSKDSIGAPYSYTDMTAEFAWKKLVSYQRLNNLAANDEYIQYHTTPTNTQAFFYMASPPSGWTKNTTQHDKALRMVDGSSGGTPGGGAQLLSSVIPLAHLHSVPAQADHLHTINHTHTLDSGTQNVVRTGFALVEGHGRIATGSPVGAAAPGFSFSKNSLNPTEPIVAAGGHDHGGTTDSQLTDITLAYVDVIWCSKN